MPFSEGETVGPYRILAQLGQGGMATVYKAYHAALDRYVALKVLHPAFTDDATFMSRFQREARVVARLDHPNIVPIYDFAEYEGRPYLVMKFIEGETLKALLSEGRLSLQQITPIVEAVGAALAYAHQQSVIHRDVKPSNILISTDGKIYLTDFGLARMTQTSASLTSDQLVGTPQYISPEQAMSKPDLDARSDIYSFGVVVYEMVVGRVPFDADTPFSVVHDHIYTPLPLPRQVNPDVPEAVEAVLLKALAKNPDDRYADVSSFVKAFGAAVQSGVTGNVSAAVSNPSTKQPDVKPPAPSNPGVIPGTNSLIGRPITNTPGGSAGKSGKPNKTAWIIGIIVGLVLCCVVGLLVTQSFRKDKAAAATETALAAQMTPSLVISPGAVTSTVNAVVPAAGVSATPSPDVVNAVMAWRQDDMAQAQTDIDAFEKNVGIANVTAYRSAFQYIQDQQAWLVAAMAIFNPLHPLGGEFRFVSAENVRGILYLAATDPQGDDFFNAYGSEEVFTAATLRHELYFGNVDQMKADLENDLTTNVLVQRYPELKLLEVELYVKQGDFTDARTKYDQLNLQSLPAWAQEIATQVSKQIS